jgi:hypothetical protein
MKPERGPLALAKLCEADAAAEFNFSAFSVVIYFVIHFIKIIIYTLNINIMLSQCYAWRHVLLIYYWIMALHVCNKSLS